MNKIRILPEILANKIAAGEIIERPASVIKELVENSIDAGARTVSVEVEIGGKKLLGVRDDGEGMTQDDALLAFEHHATSKLKSAEDLNGIATLGFRGEALPSIGSVSRLTLRTRARAAEPDVPGTEIHIQGGTMKSVKPVAWHEGTEVIVRDLFHNMPARRKFLRSNETELGHITRLVTHYALAHPGMRFELRSDGRVLMQAAPVGTLRERVFQLFGDALLEHLTEISGRKDYVRVHGFSSLPHEQRTNPYTQFFYVNRRVVRDKVIASAVRQAYRNCMPASAYPVVLLFVELPFDQVDVNAHPAKTEIRFRQQGVVHDLIRDSIEAALVRHRTVPVYEHRPSVWPGAPAAALDAQAPAAHPAQDQAPFDFTPHYAAADPFQRAFHYPFRDTASQDVPVADDHRSMRVRPDMLLDAAPAGRPFNPAGVRILGQLQESYIIAADSYGLLIIDQHVAHERILYEKLAAAVQKGQAETQGLLVPMSLELPPHQVAMLRKLIPELRRNGFEVEHFGGASVLVRSVPAIAKDEDCAKLISEILEGLDREDRVLDVDRIRDSIAVSMACRAAIKVHMPLTTEKMQWLLDELAQTRIPTNCPHGRPVILRFSLYEIERNFGRV